MRDKACATCADDWLMLSVGIFVVIGFSSIWVWRDAERREWSGGKFVSRAWMWPVGTLLAWIIVLPIYLFQRNRVPVKG